MTQEAINATYQRFYDAYVELIKSNPDPIAASQMFEAFMSMHRMALSGEWQPIETAPKTKSVLGYGMTIDGPIMTVIFYLDLPKSVYADPEQWRPPGWADVHCGIRRNWTHWMPLPKPPEGK